MNRSEQIGELMGALAKAQSEFTFASKDSTNPAFNSKYADLAANISAVRPSLSKHGIALMQFDESDVERQTGSVTTSLYHGEQWISITAEAPAVGLKGFNVQSLGACWTYLRRYTLQALCGLASDDDDGNSLAIENKPTPKKRSEVLADAQKRADEMQQRPPEAGVFEVLPDGVKCLIRGVTQKKTAGDHPKPYVNVVWNGFLHGFSYATSFDTALFDPLLGAVNQVCELKLRPWKDGDKFVNIIGVASINGQPVSEETTTAA